MLGTYTQMILREFKLQQLFLNKGIAPGSMMINILSGAMSYEPLNSLASLDANAILKDCMHTISERNGESCAYIISWRQAIAVFTYIKSCLIV